MGETTSVPKKSAWPAVGLFFVAPLVAEFLLGNLPITMLPALIVLAPMYGGGALLIRELVRRTGRGWPSIVILGLAYGIVEEAYTTQSLFNPNYLKLNLHLLQPAYIPQLGIGGWWTVFVLTIHVAWSISASIVLVEAAVPERAETPWLGNLGLGVTVMLFVFGLVATTRFQLKQDAFRASHTQLIASGVTILLLVVAAFLLSKRKIASDIGTVPNPWIVGGVALLAGCAVQLTPNSWKWGAVAVILAIDFAIIAVVLVWAKRSEWNLGHKLALGAGAAIAYGLHAFIEKPVVGGKLTIIRIGNAIFFAAAVGLIAVAARRTAASKRGIHLTAI